MIINNNNKQKAQCLTERATSPTQTTTHISRERRVTHKPNTALKTHHDAKESGNNRTNDASETTTNSTRERERETDVRALSTTATQPTTQPTLAWLSDKPKPALVINKPLPCWYLAFESLAVQ